jgi:hypothetical protein
MFAEPLLCGMQSPYDVAYSNLDGNITVNKTGSLAAQEEGTSAIKEEASDTFGNT